MAYINRPVAFDSINFLPGFPGNSDYSCNPWDMTAEAGACAVSPVAVGRETSPISDATAMALSALAAGSKAPMGLSGSDRSARFRRVALSGGGERDYHRRSGGVAGLGDSCGCGGRCGCGQEFVGMGQIDLSSTMSTITTWVEANWMPLLVGGAVIWFLKKKR